MTPAFFWLYLFVVPLGGLPADAKMETKVGPFANLAQCYGMGTLAIGDAKVGLNVKHPDKDFFLSCSPNATFPKGPRLTMWQAYTLVTGEKP